MTTLFAALLLFAQTPNLTLNSVRAEPVLERRAKLAVELAALAEREAEAGYAKQDMNHVAAALKEMVTAVELADASLQKTGKSPRRHPGPFKSAELQTQGILNRLRDLHIRMDSDERPVVEGPQNRLQEIHDAWFEGIMSKKK